jgi:hypothetical protein
MPAVTRVVAAYAPPGLACLLPLRVARAIVGDAPEQEMDRVASLIDSSDHGGARFAYGVPH